MHSEMPLTCRAQTRSLIAWVPSPLPTAPLPALSSFPGFSVPVASLPEAEACSLVLGKDPNPCQLQS